MSNCKSGLMSGLEIFKPTKKKIREVLIAMLSNDGDLEESDIIFHIDEAFKIYKHKSFVGVEAIFKQVFDVLESQEYYGATDITIVPVKGCNEMIIVSWIVGGNCSE